MIIWKEVKKIENRITNLTNKLAEELEKPLRESKGVGLTGDQLIKSQLFTSLHNVNVIMEMTQELGD